MSLFELLSYKEALKLILLERKNKRRAVTFEALALYCGIQKTYLSKVLNKDGNLSIDQLYLACEYLKLSAAESSFVENLFILNTSIVSNRKNKAQQILERLRKENLKSESAITIDNDISLVKLGTEKYYLDPYYQLIHMFLTVERFSMNPILMSSILGLTEKRVNSLINDMTDWKILEQKNGRVVVLKSNMHLTKDSYLNTAFRNFSRIASSSKINALDEDEFYSFSAVISCDEKTKSKIQQRFLEFLKSCQNDVIRAKSDDVYQINFDLLKWS
ncbi:MAG: DUF4423 domain-containing protein [Bdellovibrionaceae bacterium]|nr:DUF4423 domain-containing protein [Pseudobdellovibrionaceae bacterium]